MLVAALVRHRLRVSGLLLQDNLLGDMGVEAISAVLGVCTSLRTLDLSWNRFGSKGAKALASSLAAGSSSPQVGLRSLCMRGNRIGDEGVMRIADALGSGQCSLTRLDLWDESISDAGIGALAASLPHSNLKVLGLWGTPVTDGYPGSGLHDSTGLAAIAHAIPLAPQLIELNLFGNAVITPAGCQALCAAVKLGSLTGLTLSIDLPPSLAEALRRALDGNSAKQPQPGELAEIDEEVGYDPTDVNTQAETYLAMAAHGQQHYGGGNGRRGGGGRRRGGRQAREIAAERRARAAGGMPANRRPGGTLAKRTHPTLEGRAAKEPVGQATTRLARMHPIDRIAAEMNLSQIGKQSPSTGGTSGMTHAGSAVHAR